MDAGLEIDVEPKFMVTKCAYSFCFQTAEFRLIQMKRMNLMAALVWANASKAAFAVKCSIIVDLNVLAMKTANIGSMVEFDSSASYLIVSRMQL